MDLADMAERTIFGLTGLKLHLVRQNVAPAPTIDRKPEPRYTYGLTFSNREDVKKAWEKHSKDLYFGEIFQVVDEFCNWYRQTYLTKAGR